MKTKPNIEEKAGESPNEPKLSDRSPETPVCPKRRKAKAWLVLGFMVVAQAMTEPVEAAAALPQLTAMAAVRCSAWLGVAGVEEECHHSAIEWVINVGTLVISAGTSVLLWRNHRRR